VLSGAGHLGTARSRWRPPARTGSCWRRPGSSTWPRLTAPPSSRRWPGPGSTSGNPTTSTSWHCWASGQ